MEEMQNLQKQTALLEASEKIIRELDSAIDEVVDMEYQCSDDEEQLKLWKICHVVKIGRERVVDVIKNHPELFDERDYQMLSSEISE